MLLTKSLTSEKVGRQIIKLSGQIVISTKMGIPSDLVVDGYNARQSINQRRCYEDCGNIIYPNLLDASATH